MKNVFLIALFGLLWISSAHSESPSWQNKEGKPLPETEAMKSQDGFAGSVLVVTDADWKQKWETPPETKPNFNKAGAVDYGTKVFILIFFSNPAQDEHQSSNIRCDLKIIDPTGAAILSKQDMVCFSGQVASSPANQYLSAPVIGFTGDPGDPTGTWVVEVKLRDAVRRIELPLRTTFELTKIASNDGRGKAAGDAGKPLAVMEQQDMQLSTAAESLHSEVDALEKSQPADAAKPVVEKPPVNEENWAVNLIAYKQDLLAQRKAEEFAAKDIPAKVSQVEAKGDVWYRLSVDGFISQSEATAYAARAKKTLNLDSVWINKNKN
jgi:hypothetical protein